MGAHASLHRYLTLALSLAVPPRCGVCGAPCRAEDAICPRCELGLTSALGRPLLVPGLEGAWATGDYEGVRRRLVSALKFGGRPRLAARVAVAIAEGAPAELLRGAIVPVPAAPLRRRMRGFDGAEEIARALAARTGLPLCPCLRRTNGRRQVGRSRAERTADPPRVTVRSPAPGEAVLLDDVVTTGATLTACARALRAAGSRRVVALAFARSGVGSPLQARPAGGPPGEEPAWKSR